MIKPSSLRAHLTRALPSLAQNPDKLHVFMDDGHIECGGGSLSFLYVYTLTLVVTDWAEHADALIVPILAWLSVNQPELLHNHERWADGFTFRAEILNHSCADIEIQLKLSERVGVKNTAGRIDVTHFPEPPLDPYAQVENWQLFIGTEKVAEWEQKPNG